VTHAYARHVNRETNITKTIPDQTIARACGKISPDSPLPFLKTRFKNGRTTNGKNQKDMQIWYIFAQLNLRRRIGVMNSWTTHERQPAMERQ